MLNLSYNLSPILRERLQKIELLREKILLFPVSPKAELYLRWEAMLDRIYCSLAIADNPLDKNQIVKILISTALQNKEKGGGTDKNEKDVQGYKRTLDYISQHWLVSDKTVTLKDILSIYDIFCMGSLRVPTSRIQELLDYLQAHKEHPVIQAGTANLGIARIHPFTDGNGRLSRLIALLFLYKNGFDVKELVVFEKEWAQDQETFRQASQIAANAASITVWLEYFSQSLLTQLTNVFDKIKSGSSERLGAPSSFWEINDRQKEILNILKEPESTITNRRVQKQFKVSQITASRDLSKLAALRLIFVHGKGRSVYYTKV